ncbi:hypothetical protein K493DRAFT_352346 [Basidiobolus meristosporus CBS 931.73]|uniref:Uncharacterized protein n=1 Tax=Basidiobolus meristosporus CBS 931.73 TaxID=1314790 RepID=A0A1Y1Y9G2_9FUNG|nr:hypothetical protein K493DRAFT_352346 [Basidiobolus meristosporus CBS 931.73]|eukprot:ORX94618.1 hypothetical protein K493DRAFT_352346 [Basidiobolus meristosporus CBS 931.73]
MIKWSASDIRHFVNGVSLLPPDGARQINEFLRKNQVDGRKLVKLRVEDFKGVNQRWSRTLIDALEIEKKRRVTAKRKPLSQQSLGQPLPAEPLELISDRDSTSSRSEPETAVLYEEPTEYGSPPSPKPQFNSEEKVGEESSFDISPTPNQLFFDRDLLNGDAKQSSRSHTFPSATTEPNYSEIDRLLRGRLEEERHMLLNDFQACLHEQQLRFHQELTLSLQDHNVNFQMDLDEALNTHQVGLIRNLEKEIAILAKKMDTEANKEKVKWVLLQASVDQWKLEMAELRNQLIQHIEEEKEKWEAEASWTSWQILASGIGIGAAFTCLLLKYAR